MAVRIEKKQCFREQIFNYYSQKVK